MVSSVAAKEEISNGVIGLDSVDVVDDFARSQSASETGCHDFAVLNDGCRVPESKDHVAVSRESFARLAEPGSELLCALADFARASIEFVSNIVKSAPSSVGDNKRILARSPSAQYVLCKPELGASVGD